MREGGRGVGRAGTLWRRRRRADSGARSERGAGCGAVRRRCNHTPWSFPRGTWACGRARRSWSRDRRRLSRESRPGNEWVVASRRSPRGRGRDRGSATRRKRRKRRAGVRGARTVLLADRRVVAVRERARAPVAETRDVVRVPAEVRPVRHPARVRDGGRERFEKDAVIGVETGGGGEGAEEGETRGGGGRRGRLGRLGAGSARGQRTWRGRSSGRG